MRRHFELTVIWCKIMCNVLEFRRSAKKYGLKRRRPTPGRESQLVRDFVRIYTKTLVGKYDYAVFIEPRIPIGCPDCVIVQYDPSAYALWNASRKMLTDCDMKILFYLSQMRKSTLDEIILGLGMSRPIVRNSLRVLLHNGDIIEQMGVFIVRKKIPSFGIKRIMSVEAKIKDWRQVVQQAQLNQLFANYSFVLMPHRVCSPQMKLCLAEADVGLFVLSKLAGLKKVRAVRRLSKFQSYLPLYFNEWIGWRLMSLKRRNGYG